MRAVHNEIIKNEQEEDTRIFVSKRINRIKFLQTDFFSNCLG